MLHRLGLKCLLWSTLLLGIHQVLSQYWLCESGCGPKCATDSFLEYTVLCFLSLSILSQKSRLEYSQRTVWRDASILNAATHNKQLWGHSGTSGRSCIPACLQVHLISFSFPGLLSGNLTLGRGCTRLHMVLQSIQLPTEIDSIEPDSPTGE